MNNLLQERKAILTERKSHDNLIKINKQIVQYILDDPDVDPHVKEYYKLINCNKKEELIKTYNYFVNLYEYLKDHQDTREIIVILQMLESEIKGL